MLSPAQYWVRSTIIIIIIIIVVVVVVLRFKTGKGEPIHNDRHVK